MDFAAQHFGRLDCVVNNAGWGGEGGSIAGISVEGFDQSIAPLLRGPFLESSMPSLTCKAGPSSILPA
jgi:NAD(P)-dependent dehydrogenase (short-subunit alcohol dehydrogenase family)